MKLTSKRKKSQPSHLNSNKNMQKQIKISLKNTLDVFFPRQNLLPSPSNHLKYDLQKPYNSTVLSPKMKSMKKVLK